MDIVEAEYTGICACCGEYFPAGTEIKFDWDTHGWVIAASHVKQFGEVCNTCFTQKSLTGACQCD